MRSITRRPFNAENPAHGDCDEQMRALWLARMGAGAAVLTGVLRAAREMVATLGSLAARLFLPDVMDDVIGEMTVDGPFTLCALALFSISGVIVRIEGLAHESGRHLAVIDALLTCMNVRIDVGALVVLDDPIALCCRSDQAISVECCGSSVGHHDGLAFA